MTSNPSANERDPVLFFEKSKHSEYIGELIRAGEEDRITEIFERFWRMMEQSAQRKIKEAFSKTLSEPSFNAKFQIAVSIWKALEFKFENTVSKLCLKGKVDVRTTFGYKCVRETITRRIGTYTDQLSIPQRERDLEVTIKYARELAEKGRLSDGNYQALVKRLKEIMAIEDLNHAELADKIHRTRYTLRLFFKGKAGPKTVAQLKKFVESRGYQDEST